MEEWLRVSVNKPHHSLSRTGLHSLVPGPRSLPNILYKRSAAGSFLGMSVGCLAAGRSRSYLKWTPLVLVIALAAAQAVEISSGSLIQFVNVGNQASPQQVYFGTEYHSQDLSRYAIPVEVLCGFFFIVIAIAFLGPGQELGRALKRWPNRVQAYTLNIIGSIVGISLFAACSWLELPRSGGSSSSPCGLSYFYFISPQVRFSTKLFWVPVTVAPVDTRGLAVSLHGPPARTS